ncbi:MAG: 2-oxoacid:ferredoxin oxidoreductase subunit beta [Clostridiales bacterium]
MENKNKFNVTDETAWCPGCGNFAIIDSLKNSLNELDLDPYKVLVVGGIGQAAKTPQYLNTNGFCGLHGRSLPPAVAAKIVNKELTVIINTGDGDAYGEGGNHFIHNVRRNVNVAHFVHDNQIYGLTKGQASPTTEKGQVTKVQTMGSVNLPMNPILLAISLGAGFVARSFSGRKDHLKEMMKKAIEYNGYALVDILQPCVSFNKVNTFQWYNKRVYELEKSYDEKDRLKAIEKSMEWGDKIPIGVIYKENKSSYTDNINFLSGEETLVDMSTSLDTVRGYIQEFK